MKDKKVKDGSKKTELLEVVPDRKDYAKTCESCGRAAFMLTEKSPPFCRKKPCKKDRDQWIKTYLKAGNFPTLEETNEPIKFRTRSNPSGN